VVLTSEGQRDAAINNADGEKQQVIKASEAASSSRSTRPKAASAILAVASATAEGIRRVAETIRLDGGYEAVQLRVAEQPSPVRAAGAVDDAGCPHSLRRRRHDRHGDAGAE
jgi:regulator of protease activity HflC (stomatin/prohibitin superfamily)